LRFVQGSDVIYHCAAELNDNTLIHQTNVIGTANLLAVAKNNVRRWVQLSSTGVYGRPMHKDINEESSIHPINAYEKSKAKSDELVIHTSEKHCMECVILRPSNVYGIDMPNQSLFHMINMIHKGQFFFIGKSGAVANYIHVENVVDALILSATSILPESGRVYIVSDHCDLEAFVNIITTTLGKSTIRLRLPEFLIRKTAEWGNRLGKFPLTLSRCDALTSTTIYRANRIESELGFRHNMSIQQGVVELTDFWKNRST
jgi:nucleoside-diphosphate-sugar epimerase